MKKLMHLSFAALLFGASTCLLTAQGDQPAKPPKDVTRVAVVFSGGHETDARDGGRPVGLIAAALGVPPEVFREAFSHVHPADPNVGPTGDEARQNKAALLGALGKYGITNERLDKVSNYYRYNRGRGELWRTQSAAANALVKDGAIVGYELVSGGSGYSSPPTVTVPNLKSVAAEVKLAFGTKFENNGAVSAITIPEQSK